MTTTKVAVIGGGVDGVTTAYGLARRGAAVTLVDDTAAGQATAAGAGIIAPWMSASDGASSKRTPLAAATVLNSLPASTSSELQNSGTGAPVP